MRPQSSDRAQPDSRYSLAGSINMLRTRPPVIDPPPAASPTTILQPIARLRLNPSAGHPSQPDHPALNPARKHVSDAALRIAVPAPADRRPTFHNRPQRFPGRRQPVFRPPHRLSTTAEPTFPLRPQRFPAARRRPVFRPPPQIEHHRRPDIPYPSAAIPDGAFSAPVWCSPPPDCTSRRPTAKKEGRGRSRARVPAHSAISQMLSPDRRYYGDWCIARRQTKRGQVSQSTFEVFDYLCRRLKNPPTLHNSGSISFFSLHTKLSKFRT